LELGGADSAAFTVPYRVVRTVPLSRGLRKLHLMNGFLHNVNSVANVAFTFLSNFSSIEELDLDICDHIHIGVNYWHQ
jgi:hypothetical protein